MNYKRYFISLIFLGIFLLITNLIKKKPKKILNDNNNTIEIKNETDVNNAKNKPIWIWEKYSEFHPIELVLPLRQLNVTYNKQDNKFYYDNEEMEWIGPEYNQKGYWVVNENQNSFQIDYKKLPIIIFNKS